MLGIVLFILKMIGIILAVILGILIVVLCLVLFVPVRYRGRLSVADLEEGVEKKNISANFSVAWLLRIVRILVSYEKTVRLQVKILFFTILDTAREVKPSRKTKKQKKDKQKGGSKNRNDRNGTEPGTEGQDDSPEQDRQSVRQDVSEDTEVVQGQKANEGTDRNIKGNIEEHTDKEEGVNGDSWIGQAKKQTGRPKAGSGGEKPGFRQRIFDIIYTIKNFCDKLKGIKEKGSNIWEFWVSDHMRKSRSILGKQLLYLMKHIKPRKLEGRLAFGFEDPSVTGYMMALYGILYPSWPADVMVEPDFEEQVLLCNLKMKGRIRICHFARALLILLFSKDVRHVIKDIKSGKVF